jgi:penicillin amidase
MKRSFAIALFVFSTFFLIIPGFSQDIVVLPGLKASVTVRRDARSIPYIDATSDADLYFAQGYITASDRLWQMDLMRRVGRGETAELFGSQAVEQDKHWRQYNFAKVVDENLRLASPELRSALENYARGVNAFIEGLDDKTLPIEFRILQYKPRPWLPTDTLIIGKLLADALSTTWRQDLIRASIRDLPAEKQADLIDQTTEYDVVLFGNDRKPAAVEPRAGAFVPSAIALQKAEEQLRIRDISLASVGLFANELAASNNWVISGKKTADGNPILANDPHLQPTAPGIWYMVELSAPKLHVAGVTFPGVPGVVLGHNENIAWGATNVGPDVQDIYYETFNAEGKYRTPTGWADPVIRKEVIRVRTNLLSPATQDTMFEVTETRHGPVIVEDGGRKYALKWTALDPNNAEFGAFLKLNKALNWEEFKSALRPYGGATQNFVYADVKGHIGWYAAGKIPVRRTGDGAMPYDGSTTEGDWTGFIPFEELPNLYDPPGGLIVTANQRTVGASYKYTQFIRDAAPPWRARRIFDRLNTKAQITMDDIRDTQLDIFNIPLDNLVKAIIKLDAASPETLNVLKSWDGLMMPDSQGALLANEIRGCLANTVADDNKPAPVNAVRERILDKAIREQSRVWLPKKYASYKDFLMACDTSVRRSLSDPKRFGPDPATWTWGKVFQARFFHPLAAAPLIGGQFTIPPIGIAGSGQTPNVGSGVSMRLIASPGNWDATRQVIPLGESGDPRSPRFKDQFQAWLTGVPMEFPFSASAVEKAAPVVTVLRPN